MPRYDYVGHHALECLGEEDVMHCSVYTIKLGC